MCRELITATDPAIPTIISIEGPYRSRTVFKFMLVIDNTCLKNRISIFP